RPSGHDRNGAKFSDWLLRADRVRPRCARPAPDAAGCAGASATDDERTREARYENAADARLCGPADGATKLRGPAVLSRVARGSARVTDRIATTTFSNLSR